MPVTRDPKYSGDQVNEFLRPLSRPKAAEVAEAYSWLFAAFVRAAKAYNIPADGPYDVMGLDTNAVFSWRPKYPGPMVEFYAYAGQEARVFVRFNGEGRPEEIVLPLVYDIPTGKLVATEPEREALAVLAESLYAWWKGRAEPDPVDVV